MKKKVYLLLISIFLISAVACKKTSDPTPLPIVDANILGTVNLFDEGTTSLSNEGMVVAAEESVPFRSAISDVSGEFVMADVAFGTYTLVYTKDGYGTYKIFEVGHKNTGWSTTISEIPALGMKSSTVITSLSAMVEGDNVHLALTTDPVASQQDPRYIRLFYGDQFNIGNTNYESYSEIITVTDDPFEMILTKTNFNKMGYPSGSTVFLRVYGDSFYSNDYKDPQLGYRVFPNVNPDAAAAVSVVVP